MKPLTARQQELLDAIGEQDVKVFHAKWGSTGFFHLEGKPGLYLLDANGKRFSMATLGVLIDRKLLVVVKRFATDATESIESGHTSGRIYRATARPAVPA